jgi:hypothetical protein
MEGLARLVTESLARHGFETSLDPRRLQWSKWFRCESGLSLRLVPSKSGLLALGREMIAPGEMPAGGGKRMLAVFQISEAEDLGMALGRLLLPGSPLREELASGRCFARYAVMEDAEQRRSALAAFAQWLASSAEAASGLAADMAMQPVPPATAGARAVPLESEESQWSWVRPPAPLPSGF